MNILVYSHMSLWIDFHAETIEICLRHLKAGDKVFLLSCDGSLASCPANPYHKLESCKKCKRQTQWSTNRILNNQVVDIRLPFNISVTATPCFSSLDDLFEYSLYGVPFGELVVSQLVDDNQDCFFPLSEYQDRVHDLLSSAIHLYTFAQNTIVENHIDLVYVWNGRRCSDGPVSYAALNLGVELITHCQARQPKNILQTSSPKVHDMAFLKKDLNKTISDSVLLEDPMLLEQTANSYYNSLRYGSNIYLGGANFSRNFSKTKPKNLPPSVKPKLVIFTSSFWEYYGMSDWKGGTYDSHYDGLEQILRDRSITDHWNCIIRWHPNLANSGFYEREKVNSIMNLYSSVSYHYPPSSDVNSYALIELSSAVVTFGSTIGIEASYYGKPSILLGRSVYEDLDACYTPKTHSDLVELLANVPEPRHNQKLYATYYAYYLSNENSFQMENVSYRDNSLSKYFVNNRRLMQPRSCIRLVIFNALKSFPLLLSFAKLISISYNQSLSALRYHLRV